MFDDIDLDSIIITPRDVMAANGCVPGMRQWFKNVGKEGQFKDFLKNGLSAKEIVDTGNAYGIRVVQKTLNRIK